jgi:hypothetical protein
MNTGLPQIWRGVCVWQGASKQILNHLANQHVFYEVQSNNNKEYGAISPGELCKMQNKYSTDYLHAPFAQKEVYEEN